jgi:hypothetical protein
LEPIELGSEGGGGAIRLIVSNELVNNGLITADASGASPWRGSGGSIYVAANNLSGTGSFTANGKFFGAGGRIAIYYNTSSFTGIAVAVGGDNSSGADGTVGFIDMVKNTLYVNSSWRFIKDDGAYNFNHIIISDDAFATAEDGAIINVEDIRIEDGATFLINSGVKEDDLTIITVAAIVITNNSQFIFIW